MFITSINLYSQSVSEPINIKFNRVHYFFPGDEFSVSITNVKKISSYVTIDFELNTVEILTYYSNPPTESTYKIKSIDNTKGSLYKFVCIASNYAEVIIEIDLTKMVVTRKVTHNGILHKYYNE